MCVNTLFQDKGNKRRKVPAKVLKEGKKLKFSVYNLEEYKWIWLTQCGVLLECVQNLRACLCNIFFLALCSICQESLFYVFYEALFSQKKLWTQPDMVIYNCWWPVLNLGDFSIKLSLSKSIGILEACFSPAYLPFVFYQGRSSSLLTDLGNKVATGKPHSCAVHDLLGQGVCIDL